MTRPTSSSFDTEVAKKQLRPVELLDIFFGIQTADDANTLHFAIHDAPVTFFNTDGGAQIYTPIGVRRSEMSNVMDNEQRKVTLEIDNIDRTFQAFFFQNADFMRDKRVVLRTVLLDALAAAADAVRTIDGTIDTITITERICQIDFHGAIGNLTFRTGWPLDRICPYNFVSTLCAQGVTVQDLLQKTADTAASGSTKTTIKAATLGQPDGFWAVGTIKFTSGVNNGITRKVIKWTQSSKDILLDFGLPDTPGVGDGFDISRDCDKTFKECKERYTEVDATKGNSDNFGGFQTVVHSINP